jgi:uncharacterized membrane protein
MPHFGGLELMLDFFHKLETGATETTTGDLSAHFTDCGLTDSILKKIKIVLRD